MSYASMKNAIQEMSANASTMAKVALGATGVAAVGAVTARMLTPTDIYGPGSGLTTGDFLTDTMMNIHHLNHEMPHVNRPPLYENTWSTIRTVFGGSPDGTTPNPAGVLGKAALTGAGVGAFGAGTLGTIIARKNRAAGALMGSAMGALIGGYYGTKIAYNTAKIASTIHRDLNRMNPYITDNRAFGGGSGVRNWAKRPGGRMPAGHLGATGDLVHAMHKTRHRSMF